MRATTAGPADGGLLMPNSSELFSLGPGETEWTLAHSFKDAGLADITRIALSPDGKRLALVAKGGEPETL